VLTDTEHWLNWTSAFGPLSDLESRLVSLSGRIRNPTWNFARLFAEGLVGLWQCVKGGISR
jgi:hypothetical protein